MMNWILSRGIPLYSTSFRCVPVRNYISTSNFRLLIPLAKNSCNTVSFCSSSERKDSRPKFIQPVKVEEVRKMYKFPVDWLPFEWHRRPKRNVFENSGDLVKELEYDPSWSKPDFELSDELKTASDDVKQFFSLATASKGEIKEVIKRNILKKIQRHPHDFDSLEVQIALKTLQVRAYFQHLKEAPKTNRSHNRVTLYVLINKRNKKVKDLYRLDRERCNWLLKELKLEYTPTPLGRYVTERYCKKWDLRRHTKMYSKMLIDDKKAVYHEELKRQQADFLKEKEEILAWIEKEEKELENLDI